MIDLTMLHGPAPGPMTVDGLSRAYAGPPSGPWIRAMMAFTLDGAVTGPDRRSKSISSPLDRMIMAEVRRQSDVILIGAGTFRAERYRPLNSTPAEAEVRAARGLAEAPRLAIVSPSLDLPWEEDVFHRSRYRPVVFVAGDPGAERLRTARENAEIVLQEGSGIDFRQVISWLSAHRLERVVCEGGPTLLAGLTELDLIDEADVTISPVTTSGGQIDSGRAPIGPASFDIAHVILAGDGALFTRYLREAKDPTPR